MVHIPGYDGYEAKQEMLNDAPPDGVLTRFSVEKELMPYLSALENKEVYQNFIHVRRTHDLGKTDQKRRIHDTVSWDEKAEKWKVIKLAPGELSDIKRNPTEWAAFYESATAHDIGTPLTVLFRNDPAKCESYAFYHVRTVESLARMNEQDLLQLGSQSRLDKAKAVEYLERAKSGQSESRLQLEVDVKNQQLDTLSRTVLDLQEKLTELLRDQAQNDFEPVKRRPGRPKVNKEISDGM